MSRTLSKAVSQPLRDYYTIDMIFVECSMFVSLSSFPAPRQCCVCGKWAELECKECYGSIQFGAGLESTSFCKTCLEKVHSHDKRTNHQPRELIVSPDFLCMAEHLTVPRIFMELFAVVCIETSHYVAFVKSGSGLDAPWCFFDSMADRKGWWFNACVLVRRSTLTILIILYLRRTERL